MLKGGSSLGLARNSMPLPRLARKILLYLPSASHHGCIAKKWFDVTGIEHRR